MVDGRRGLDELAFVGAGDGFALWKKKYFILIVTYSILFEMSDEEDACIESCLNKTMCNQTRAHKIRFLIRNS